jgi:LPXTG-motif cell wall-anchored protein
VTPMGSAFGLALATGLVFFRRRRS